MIDLGSEGNGSVYTNQTYALTTKFCSYGAKSYIIWEEFTAGMCLVVQSVLQLHTQMTL